ncbi:MAG: hypothetical protein EOO40_05600, partial [Deltaproteobacteria bacterium]
MILRALVCTLLAAQPSALPQAATAPQAAKVAAQPPATEPQPQQSQRVVTDAATRIGKGLRCPVCQGMPIAESPASMAQDMMKLVREMLAQGKSAEQIEAYFVGRYGEWVLLQPPAHGFNWLVWLLPPLSLLLALAWMLLGRRPGAPSVAPAVPQAE